MATVTKTTIANLALSHLRQKQVLTDVDADPSFEAKTMSEWYDPARRTVIVDANPGFSRKRAELAAHAEAPPPEWGYRYIRPSDCMFSREIVNPLGPDQPRVPFEEELAADDTYTILTNVGETANLLYNVDGDNTEFFTPHFVVACSWALAAYAAGAITGKQSIEDKAWANYNLAVNTDIAHRANASAASTMPRPLPDWLRERFGGASATGAPTSATLFPDAQN